MLVQKAIESCKGLPLAISVIGGLNLQSDNDWQDLVKRITNKDLETEVLLHDYDFNLFVTFQLSVNQLNQRDQHLFRSLMVFKPVKISLQSIISLWGLQDLSKDMITIALKKLHQHSLLIFVDSCR